MLFDERNHCQLIISRGAYRKIKEIYWPSDNLLESKRDLFELVGNEDELPYRTCNYVNVYNYREMGKCLFFLMQSLLWHPKRSLVPKFKKIEGLTDFIYNWCHTTNTYAWLCYFY